MISDETPKGVLRKMVPWNPGWKKLLYSVINERKHFFFFKISHNIPIKTAVLK